VKRDCTLDEVKAAYRAMAKQTHPDVRFEGAPGGHQEFLRVSDAVKVLSSPMLRAAYDLELARLGRSASTAHGTAHATRASSEGKGGETPPTSSEYVPPMYTSSRTTEADTTHFRNIINARGPKSTHEREIMRNARAAPLHAFSAQIVKLIAVPVAFGATIAFSWTFLTYYS
jgi:DnaJ-class molecular chaperone